MDPEYIPRLLKLFARITRTERNIQPRCIGGRHGRKGLDALGPLPIGR